jgi:hypothetical protein
VWRVGLAFALAAVAIGATTVVFGSQEDSGPPPRPEITRAYLEQQGMRLGPPDPEQPVVISRDRAERVARHAAPSPVLGSVLATCRETEEDVGYPCWVVAHDPAGHQSSGPRGAQRIPAAYLVSIIDSRTGEWVAGQMGGPGGPAPVRDRLWAKESVEQAIVDWNGSHVRCRDGVRPDFRGRPAFACRVGTAQGPADACYAVVGDNLFRMACAGSRTDSGRLVHRG